MSANSSEKLALYQASVSQIIRRAVDLYNWPALDTETLARRMAVWSETLGMIIPVERLRECFDKAVLEHEGDYPINAFELIKVWKFIEAQDAQQRVEREQLAFVAKHCFYTHHNEELRTKIEVLFDVQYELPCYGCRHYAYLVACNKISAAHKDAELTRQFDQEMKRMDGREPPRELVI